ncbi:MAG: uroporphyrinogen decarboxylase [Acidimicrobiia bacterium]|nr:uroporphyrinogen decarboxylase [Acidimicrobiia bacterium]
MPGSVGSVADSPFLLACRSRPTERVPVWFMRQAGRSLPEYRAVRERHGRFDITRTPELAAEVTMQPVRRLGVDAAILFSDIVVPLKAVGVDVELKAGVGPVIAEPFRTVADLDRLRPLEPDDISYVAETVRAVVGELPVPLIGFAGAPFTLASYLVEGGPSRTYAHTKALMYTEPETWAELLSALADITAAFLRVQIEAGAAAVQVFDSWAGALSPDDYQRSVLPASAEVFDGLSDLDVPTIHFGVNTGELLPLMADAGPDVVGVDWRVPIDAARKRLGPGVAVQGNLDPAVCLSPWDAVERKVRDILVRNGGQPGHVFNLGHGVLPETDPDVLRRIVDLVHAVD